MRVAPVRERGLKSLTATVLPRRLKRRSREGAWIEIAWRAAADVPLLRRSREGAWIEIGYNPEHLPTPFCRSREGAWIEIICRFQLLVL